MSGSIQCVLHFVGALLFKSYLPLQLSYAFMQILGVIFISSSYFNFPLFLLLLRRDKLIHVNWHCNFQIYFLIRIFQENFKPNVLLSTLRFFFLSSESIKLTPIHSVFIRYFLIIQLSQIGSIHLMLLSYNFYFNY